MAENKYGFAFKLAQWVTRILIPRYQFEQPPLEGKPVVYVSHHQNMVGPVSILAWIKYYVRTWILSEFTERESCYHHYKNITFRERYGWPKWFAQLVAWPASYVIPWVTSAANAIPVYRKSRKIVKTMKISQEALMNGESILIFPDIDYSDDSKTTSDIYQGFLHLEKRYFKATGEHLTFLPIFADSDAKMVRVGEEIQFTGDKAFIDERETIAEKIKEELNRLAQIEATPAGDKNYENKH